MSRYTDAGGDAKTALSFLSTQSSATIRCSKLFLFDIHSVLGIWLFTEIFGSKHLIFVSADKGVRTSVVSLVRQWMCIHTSFTFGKIVKITSYVKEFVKTNKKIEITKILLGFFYEIKMNASLSVPDVKWFMIWREICFSKNSFDFNLTASNANAGRGY